jgi:hypothetical protein
VGAKYRSHFPREVLKTHLVLPQLFAIIVHTQYLL